MGRLRREGRVSVPQFPHLQEGRDGGSGPGDAAAAPL